MYTRAGDLSTNTLGFLTTNAGDSTSTMFDLASLAVVKQIHAGASGLDGFMYDDATNKALTINHSRPNGTAVVIDAASGDVVTKFTTTGAGQTKSSPAPITTRARPA